MPDNFLEIPTGSGLPDKTILPIGDFTGSILAELTAIFQELSIPFETGAFSDPAPDCYVVAVPLTDEFDGFADDRPWVDVQEVRLSLYSKGNYLKIKNQIVKALLQADFTITDRQYIEYENDTKYHHYNIDVLKHYPLNLD